MHGHMDVKKKQLTVSLKYEMSFTLEYEI